MPYAGNAAVAGRIAPKCVNSGAIPPDAVQNKTTESAQKSAGNSRSLSNVLDSGLLPMAEAAAALGISEKRLRGYVWRNKLGDPIGDIAEVYGWSCRALAERLRTDTSSGVA